MRRWWVVYSVCTAAVGLALVWVSGLVLDLEEAEAMARAETRRQELSRLALWRMDSWLAPRLAREAARPYFEYGSYYGSELAYTRMLQPLETGEVLTPSPLLAFSSDLFPLHFQLEAGGELSSPQVPTGAQRELAVRTASSEARVALSEARLQALSQRLDPSDLYASLVEARCQVQDLTADRGGPSLLPSPGSVADDLRQGRLELARRLDQARFALDGGAPPLSEDWVTVGELAPVWTDTEELLFVREVWVGDDVLFQGFEVDWPRLREALSTQVADLLPETTLVALPSGVETPEGSAGFVLASVPALLHVPPVERGVASLVSPARSALVLTWLAVAIAVGAVGHTLRSSLALAERRSRFASAVSHELRTPLTTFRMYCEMLAEDMVSDETQRRAYLQTLSEESDRLARLVENVLVYARLEEGRAEVKTEDATVDEVMERLAPALERRAEEAGLTLLRDTGTVGSESVSLDVTAVGQILFNLVDNACKYAGGGEPSRVHIEARATEGMLELTVRDHGPGVPADARARVFQPFERHEPGAAPGVGLGLALSRTLARELGGDLVLDGGDGGAVFRLRLPRAG